MNVDEELQILAESLGFTVGAPISDEQKAVIISRAVQELANRRDEIDRLLKRKAALEGKLCDHKVPES